MFLPVLAPKEKSEVLVFRSVKSSGRLVSVLSAAALWLSPVNPIPARGQGLAVRTEAAHEPMQKSVEVFVQLGHTEAVNSVAFSPDGRYIASGGEDKTLRLWEADTGREVLTFEGVESPVKSVAFSPDGRNVLARNAKALKLWDVTTGRVSRTFFENQMLTFDASAAFSPDGRYVAADDNDELKLWEVGTQRVRSLKGKVKSVSSIAFSPDGQHVVAGQSLGVGDIGIDTLDGVNTLRMWDVNTGQEVEAFTGSVAGVSSVAFSPDGRYLVSGERGKLRLWDVAGGHQVRVFMGHKYGAKAIAFSPDGRHVISAGSDHTLKLWEVGSGKEITAFKTPSSVNSVAFSPNGRHVASGGRDRSLYLWEIGEGRQVRVFSGRSTKVDCVAFSPDGQYVASGNGRKLKLWDVKKGRELRTISLDTPTSFVVFSPDSRYAVAGGSYRNSFSLHDVNTGRKVTTFSSTSRVNSVAFSPDGRYLMSAGAHSTLVLWDVRTGRAGSSYRGIEDDDVQAVAFSPDGLHVAVRTPKALKLWGSSLEGVVRTFFDDAFFTLSPAPVAFSPDGKYVATDVDNKLKLWEVSTGREAGAFKVSDGSVNALAFSPGGDHLVSGGDDNTVRVWDVSTGREMRAFTGHTSDVTSVAFSPNGRYVVSGSVDGTTRLWNVSSGREEAKYVAFDNGEWVVVTPEGYYNASSDGDQHLNVRVGSRVYGIDQFKVTFYKPQVVEAVAQAGNSGTAVKEVLDSGKPDIADATRFQPPFVVIKSPDDGQQIGTLQSQLSAVIEDRNQPLKSVRVFINGRQAASSRGAGVRLSPHETGNVDIAEGQKRLDLKLTLTLESGENQIEVVAANAYAEERKTVRVAASAGAAPARDGGAGTNGSPLPRLWILSIGVSRSNPQIGSLDYPAKDSEAIVTAFKRQEGRLFSQVHSLVINDTASIKPTTENILDNLDYLRQASQHDVVLLFMAGHGVNDERGDYYFLPSDAAFDAEGGLKRSKAISWRDIKATLELPAKILVFLDTCHSEGVSGRKTRSVDNDRLVRELQELRAVIFTSSRGTELSQESHRWGHGAFTYALLKGLGGEADSNPKDGVVMMKELDAFVSSTVSSLTNGSQHPITWAPDGYKDFPMSKLR